MKKVFGGVSTCSGVRIQALVPVAPGEPVFIVEESVECLREAGLDPVYVADRPTEELVAAVEGKGGCVVPRETCRGRRAGALNDGLSEMESEFVAVMDVDSRPSKRFVERCVVALRHNPEAFLASGPRRVTNEDTGAAALAVSAEYRLIGDLYRLLHRRGGFLQFNGLIGVARTDVLRELALDETAACEDVELASRAHLDGHRAVFVPEEVGEQAPPTVQELYSQRVRWLTGALESAAEQGRAFATGNVDRRVRSSWYTQMAAPFLLVLLAPLFLLSPLYGARLHLLGENRVLAKSLLLPLLGILLSVCSAVAIARFVAGSRPAWDVASRT